MRCEGNGGPCFKAMKFQNPANGYVEETKDAWLWCLLFGCIYFAVKGIWTHAIAAAVLAILTVGLSWLIYPFFANDIVRTHYLRKGWVEVPKAEAPVPSREEERFAHKRAARRAAIFLLIVAAVLIALTLGEAVRQAPGVSMQAPGVVSKTGGVTDQNEWLLTRTPTDQAEWLALVVSSSVGEECSGKDVFYQGLSSDGLSAYWSVRCTNGREYQVTLRGHAKDTTSVEDCQKSLNKNGPCFQKITGTVAKAQTEAPAQQEVKGPANTAADIPTACPPELHAADVYPTINSAIERAMQLALKEDPTFTPPELKDAFGHIWTQNWPTCVQ
jgi:hypothetical protein